MQWVDEVPIETPEQLDLGLELSGLGSRFVAKMVDWLYKGLVFFVAWLVVLGTIGTGALVGVGSSYSVVLLAFLIALSLAFLLGYDIVFELRNNGQTPGKKFAGIRVVRESGAPVDFSSSCIRNVLSLIDFLPFYFLFGSFVALLNSRTQRLGDIAAGTIVVRERAAELPKQETVGHESLASDEFQFTAEHLRNFTAADRHILRSFFQRYSEMNQDARHQLACRLAQQLLDKTTYQPDPPVWPYPRAERFLASLYRDLNANSFQG